MTNEEKNIIHDIYFSMIIRNYTKSFISMTITKLSQHSINLRNLWIKKHEISYHEHDDTITFHFEHCNHLKSIENFFSEETKKKLFVSKEKLFDQSEVDIQDIKNKELLIFLEKNNNSKMVLKKSTSDQVVESVTQKLNEHSKKFIEFLKRLN